MRVLSETEEKVIVFHLATRSVVLIMKIGIAMMTIVHYIRSLEAALQTSVPVTVPDGALHVE